MTFRPIGSFLSATLGLALGVSMAQRAQVQAPLIRRVASDYGYMPHAESRRDRRWRHWYSEHHKQPGAKLSKKAAKGKVGIAVLR